MAYVYFCQIYVVVRTIGLRAHFSLSFTLSCLCGAVLVLLRILCGQSDIFLCLYVDDIVFVYACLL